MMFKLIKVVSIIFAFTIMNGCAFFSGGQVPQTKFKSAGSESLYKPKISYSFNAVRKKIDTEEVDKISDKAKNKSKSLLHKALVESGYFSEVIEEQADSDIFLDVTITDSYNPAALIAAAITGYSMYTIPSWATNRFEVKASASNKGGIEKIYTLNDTATLVQWAPMVFLFPFNNMSVIDETQSNMYRNIIVQMNNDVVVSTEKEAKYINQ